MYKYKLATCKKCGWVGFCVTRKFAENAVKEFNEWFEKQSKEVKDMYGNKGSSIKSYERCFFCGGSYKNTRKYNPKKDNNITGHTLNPIIYRNE